MTLAPAALNPTGELAQAIAACRSALTAYGETPEADASRAGLRRAQAAVARLVAAQGGKLAGWPGLAAALELQREIAASGVFDLAVSDDEISLANDLLRKGPAGLLAAMLLVPAWQWNETPAFTEIPENLWPIATAWLFHTPQGFCAVGQAEAYAAHFLRRLEELDRLVGSRGKAHMAKTIDAFVRTANSIPLYFSDGALRRHMELRGRILTAWASPERRDAPVAQPREGRRLRVGFINRHFGSQTETYTTLPTFEQLDAERYEVLLFACHYRDTALEQYAAGRAAKFSVLSGKLSDQLKVLRDARLDIAVFGTNVTAVMHEVTQLALHRVAPLQVVNNSSCTTTGLPEIDLFVSGDATEREGAAADFTERLGLVRGPAHAFNYDADRQEPSGEWTREMLGLSESDIVFVSAANFFKVTPETQHTWARLLAGAPGSKLLLHPFNPNWSSQYPVKRFCADFDRVLAEHGVSSDRLVVSTVRLPSRSDVRELMRLGDLYLDTFPFAGVNSLVDPLEAGVPVVSWEGETFRSRMGAALLRQLGFNELIVRNETDYLSLAAQLAADKTLRASWRERIADAMARLPLFLDTLAASDAFGALIELAYDELVARGREEFRRDPQPIVASYAASSELRQARGRELLVAGRVTRAVDYLVAAVQRDEGNASLWCDLAGALRQDNRINDALNALQTCLQLDPQCAGAQKLLNDFEAGLKGRNSAATDDRPHVLIYTDDPGEGGVAQYNLSLMSGLVAAGYRVSCAQTHSENPLVQAQRELGVENHWIPYNTGKDFARTLGDEDSASRIIDAAQPDLIVFSDCCPLSNLGAREVARKRGVPYVVVVGFVGAYLADRFKGLLGRLAGQYAEAREVIAVSQENLSLLRNRFGLPAVSGRVIHYGRPEKFFAPRNEKVRARLRAEIGLLDDAVVCFTAARLTAVKGFLYQVIAAKHVVAQSGCEKLHFVWAGDGDQRGPIEKAVAASGLAGRIHFLGHRWDVADWYDAVDIFALPSDLEGMPLAIMEAMAKGLPVVATAVSGIPEELGGTGKLLPSAAQDRAGLIRELVRTLGDWTREPQLRRIVGEAGRLRAGEMFREALMIERTVALVGEQLAAPEAAVASA